MRTWLKKLWPWLKAVLIVALLVWIGREFARDLGKDPHLLERTLRPGWLVLSGLLYLAGLAFSALYWDRLLRHLGQRPAATATVRAYYLGHLGKYLPGKAWALLMRVGMARTAGVRVGIAVMTTFSEVLTTMASGALLAVVLFLLLAPAGGPDWDNLVRLVTFRDPEPETAPLDRWVLAALALLVLAPTIGPILPPVFNRLVQRLTRRFRQVDAAPLPPVGWRPLGEGLAVIAVGWLLLGLSLWAALHGLLSDPPAWDWAFAGQCTACIAVAYVAGFVLGVPAGGGVREFFLKALLVPLLAPLLTEADGSAAAVAARAALVLRLVWTVAEVLIAAGLYWLPGRAAEEAAKVAEESGVKGEVGY